MNYVVFKTDSHEFHYILNFYLENELMENSRNLLTDSQFEKFKLGYYKQLFYETDKMITKIKLILNKR